MKTFEQRLERISHMEAGLRSRPATWLVTGAAGFIGSHLAERLLALGQRVVGLDNFATGQRRNLPAHENFRFIEGDIRDLKACREACRSVELVLHQAALGSVPRSIDDPVATHEANVSGFLNMLVAARDAGVSRMVYASSSAVYGDHPGLPKTEGGIGRALSPYAASKHMNELYAGVFAGCYGFDTVGLRYFNVFGPRQDPNGAYAAVIPAFISALLLQRTSYINGDGATSRDFCYVDNVVQANLLAATVEDPAALNQVYNIAYGERTTLLELFEMIRAAAARRVPSARIAKPVHREPRRGDVRHSLADITKAQTLLGYAPRYRVQQGLEKTVEWYAAHLLAFPETVHA